MQVISGPIGAPTVHFEAPSSKQVPAEMKRFVSLFNRTGQQGTIARDHARRHSTSIFRVDP
jgi:hypothetical protein